MTILWALAPVLGGCVDCCWVCTRTYNRVCPTMTHRQPFIKKKKVDLPWQACPLTYTRDALAQVGLHFFETQQMHMLGGLYRFLTWTWHQHF